MTNLTKDEPLILWEGMCQCECGGELYFKQDKRLNKNEIFDGTKMICIEDDCQYNTYIHFNEDGSDYDSTYDREEKEWVR